jgi:hypothetical protein
MKRTSLIAGLVIGALIGIVSTNLYRSNAPSIFKQKADTDMAKWVWADSLDAIKNAPDNHKVIFENNVIRILKVSLAPYEYEQMHTHSLPSVMFGADQDTSSFDIIYYPYTYDSTNHQYVAKDSIRQHHVGKAADPIEVHFMKPEGPHRIKNCSNTRILAYRVEFKTDLGAEQ